MIFGKTVDRIFCNISSIIYRTLIALLCIYVIGKYDAIFPKFYIFISVLAYQIIALTLFIKLQKFRTTRLLLDYVIIMFVLLSCSAPLSLSFGILILPIVNSPNHTGDNRTCLPHLLSGVSFGILAYNHNFSEIYSVISIIAYTIVGYIDILKKRIVDIVDNLYSATDDIFTGGLKYGKTNQEYNELLKKLNSFPTLNKFAKFKLLISTNSSEDSLLVIKSSNYNTSINLNQKLQINKNNGYIIIDNVIIDKDNYKNCYCYKCNYGYYHFVIFEGKPVALQMIHTQILRRLFDKIGKYLELDAEISQLRFEHARKIRNNIEFIEAADLALHFIKNKLQPISTFIEAYSFLKDSDDIKQIESQLLSFTDGEHFKALTARDNILEKSEQLLAQKRNINFCELNVITFTSIFITILKQSSEYGLPIKFIVSVDKQNSPSFIKVNEDGLSLVIYEILDNILKYHDKFIQVSFQESLTDYIVSFSNDYSLKTSKKIINAIRALRDSDAEEILARTNSGIVLIKKICNQMHVLISNEISDNIYTISIKFNKIPR